MNGYCKLNNSKIIKVLSVFILLGVVVVYTGCHVHLGTSSCERLGLEEGDVLKNRWWELPPLPEPHDYGDILMDRVCTDVQLPPVFFSHWAHRRKYTCRVCHFELDFAFVKGETEITIKDHINGNYCSGCHNDTTAFGVSSVENCFRCHTGEILSQEKEFADFRSKMKGASSGNKVDWVDAVDSGIINPVYSIWDEDQKPLSFNKYFVLSSDWALVTPSFFDHKTHTTWLDCADCHPDIFNVKKKTTKHFDMKNMLEGKFCGVCHLRVAFPVDDCLRCHPGLRT